MGGCGGIVDGPVTLIVTFASPSTFLISPSMPKYQLCAFIMYIPDVLLLAVKRPFSSIEPPPFTSQCHFKEGFVDNT